MRISFEVPASANKQKLGDFLCDNLPELSKMYLRELIKTGQCEVNGLNENSGYRLRSKDFVEVELDMSRGTAMRPEQSDLDIVYEDDELIVVNKPSGMLMHPSHRENSGTLLNGLVHHLNYAIGTPGSGSSPFIRPGLPHRLDKHTSGLVVIAKTKGAHRSLSGHFMKRRVTKRYRALVEGIVTQDSGTIEAPIARDAELKVWGVHSTGKQSVSKYSVCERRSNSTTLLELEPVTGRTNQLRIHCAAIGHPIVGDRMRGGRGDFLCLQAYKLGFPHPASGKWSEFEIAAIF